MFITGCGQGLLFPESAPPKAVKSQSGMDSNAYSGSLTGPQMFQHPLAPSSEETGCLAAAELVPSATKPAPDAPAAVDVQEGGMDDYAMIDPPDHAIRQTKITLLSAAVRAPAITTTADNINAALPHPMPASTSATASTASFSSSASYSLIGPSSQSGAAVPTTTPPPNSTVLNTADLASPKRLAPPAPTGAQAPATPAAAASSTTTGAAPVASKRRLFQSAVSATAKTQPPAPSPPPPPSPPTSKGSKSVTTAGTNASVAVRKTAESVVTSQAGTLSSDTHVVDKEKTAIQEKPTPPVASPVGCETPTGDAGLATKLTAMMQSAFEREEAARRQLTNELQRARLFVRRWVLLFFGLSGGMLVAMGSVWVAHTLATLQAELAAARGELAAVKDECNRAEMRWAEAQFAVAAYRQEAEERAPRGGEGCIIS